MQVTLQPSAGAQGELTGLMLIRACLADRGDPRKNIIVSGHGARDQSGELNPVRLRRGANLFQ